MKFDKEKMRLYAITDRHWLNGRSLKEVVKESLDGGVTFLQLRDKNSDDETFLQEAAELQELCRDYKVPLIINDNVEIALKMNADGVHEGRVIWKQVLCVRNLDRIKFWEFRHER